MEGCDFLAFCIILNLKLDLRGGKHMKIFPFTTFNSMLHINCVCFFKLYMDETKNEL